MDEALKSYDGSTFAADRVGDGGDTNRSTVARNPMAHGDGLVRNTALPFLNEGGQIPRVSRLIALIHRVTRILKATGATFPVYGTGAGGKFEFSKSVAEIPDTLNILLDCPEGMTVQLISSMANDTHVNHFIRGHKATLEFTPDGFTIKPQQLFADDVKEITQQKTDANRSNSTIAT